MFNILKLTATVVLQYDFDDDYDDDNDDDCYDFVRLMITLGEQF